jgi:hypothetical protein
LAESLIFGDEPLHLLVKPLLHVELLGAVLRRVATVRALPRLQRSSRNVCVLGATAGASRPASLSPRMQFTHAPIVSTRGSASRVIDMNLPQDCPMTATLSVAILPFSGEPARAVSASAQSIAARRLSAVARVP